MRYHLTRASLLWFCGSPWIFIQLNNFFKLPAPHSSPKWRKSARYFEIFDLLYYWLILKFRSHWTRKWVFWVISESKQCSKVFRLSPVGAEILIFHFLYSIISMEGFKKVVFPKHRAPKSKIWVVQIKPYLILVEPGTLHFWASANILRVLLKLVFNLWQKFGIHFEFWTCWFDRIFWQFFFFVKSQCVTHYVLRFDRKCIW